MPDDLSDTMRDYLAEIYRLAEHSAHPDAYVSTSALADLMMVSAPAVNRMVTKLREMGLLHHEPYQGIHLTPEGKRLALLKLRNHRIAEAFLVNVMGFEWHQIYEEAHRMSNAMSEVVSQRMLEMAQNPAYCPHGEPIPDPQGQVEDMDDILLTQAAVDTEYIVTRILTREVERLEYIAALGLMPGTSVLLIHAAPFNGPMQLKLDNEYRIIGHNLAELIRVREPRSEPPAEA